ncbi:transposase [Klebsiella pneumoniae]|uniref:Transposase n=1 Tax=Klebsiella pneumoniae TaxID=573 RepID=A0A377XII0_KLEPN|nr:transposase [Klebsiella pneumoniae]
MDEKSLYAHILNLSAPWQVKSLSLDENAGSVTVTVGIAENTRLACPGCGKSCSVHDHRHRKWRHLDTCQFTTIVEADVPRIMCPEHGLPDVASSLGWPRKPVYSAVRIVRSLMAENQHR